VSNTGTSNLNWSVTKQRLADPFDEQRHFGSGSGTNVTVTIDSSANSLLLAFILHDWLYQSHHGFGNTIRSPSLTITNPIPLVTRTGRVCPRKAAPMERGSRRIRDARLEPEESGHGDTTNLVVTLLATNWRHLARRHRKPTVYSLRAACRSRARSRSPRPARAVAALRPDFNCRIATANLARLR